MDDKQLNGRLPKDLKSLFWSYDFDMLNIEKDKRLVITQVINYGSWKQWKWLASVYGKENIKDIVAAMPATGFRASALKLAVILFSIDTLTYAPRSSH